MENYYYLSASIGGVRSGRCVAHCAFEITLLQAIMLTLLLVCAFSPRVHSIPRGPLISARNDKKCVARKNASVCKQPPNANLWLGSCPLERTRSQYLMDVNGQNVTLTGLLTAHTALLKSHCRGATMLTLLLVCAFSPRVHSIPWGPLISARNDKKCVARKNASVCKQPPNANLWLGSCPLERTRSQYLMDVNGQNVTLTGLLTAHTALLKSHCRGRQCSLFCLCAPFPREYTVSRGVPDFLN